MADEAKHRHRPHHHKHRHHHHGEHSGDGPWNRAEPVVGTVQHSLATCLASLMALDSNAKRHLALGEIAAKLVENGHISGLSEIIKHCSMSINRYDHLDDDGYIPASYMGKPW